jgi:hypothetical protein
MIGLLSTFPGARRLCALMATGLALTAPAGCGPRAQPPAESVPRGVSPAVPTGEPVAAVGELDVTRDLDFRVRVAEQRSLEVVEHFNRELAARGWKKLRPKLVELPGQRQWISTGAPVGPTEAFDAAWEHPETGRVAVLNLWHTAERPEIQHGSFELFEKERAPL